MIFSLDLRRARNGDCFLLHVGTHDKPGLILVDGGPKSVYRPFLKPRLEEIRHARGLDREQPLAVDLLMVSHVDDDHIQGILDLTRDELVAKADQRPLLLNVRSFWHNSFDSLVGAGQDKLAASLEAHFGTASLSGSGEIPDEVRETVAKDSDEDEEVVTSSLKVLASIAQGFQLRVNAEGLGYPLNPHIDGALILAQPAQTGNVAKPITIAPGLKFTVIGPMQPEVDALRKKHEEWLRSLKKQGKSPPEALAAYVDKSVPNLSSIVVMAECRGKRMLLTGDARGDKILEGLRLAGLLGLREDATLRVDLLKVPHHGSANNLEQGFFQQIIAQHYVFSGDGEHGNPEREAMEMLFDARSDEPFTVHLTYPVEEIDAKRKADWEKERTKERARRTVNPAARVRPAWSTKRHSLGAFLEQRGLAPGQAVVSAQANQAHLIDLLDPLGF